MKNVNITRWMCAQDGLMTFSHHKPEGKKKDKSSHLMPQQQPASASFALHNTEQVCVFVDGRTKRTTGFVDLEIPSHVRLRLPGSTSITRPSTAAAGALHVPVTSTHAFPPLG